MIGAGAGAVFSDFFRPRCLRFMFFGRDAAFCPSLLLARVTSGCFWHRCEGVQALEVDLAQIDRLHRVADEVGEMIGRHPVAQIRWEQQGSVAIDVYEANGHELLIAALAPIAVPVSKMSQAFSSGSLSGTARRAAPRNISLRRNSSCQVRQAARIELCQVVTKPIRRRTITKPRDRRPMMIA